MTGLSKKNTGSRKEINKESIIINGWPFFIAIVYFFIQEDTVLKVGFFCSCTELLSLKTLEKNGIIAMNYKLILWSRN